MNAHQRKQYEMLLRIEDFGKTHRHLFAASTAQQAFAAITAAIEQLTATDLVKQSASVSARAEQKGKARKTLTDWLYRVSQLARVLRKRGRPLPAFLLPPSRSDQALLSTARQFAHDAATAEPDFAGVGMGPAAIAATAAAFETALRDRGMGNAERTAAAKRIETLIASALLDVRTIELMVHNERADDIIVQAVWKQARRVDDARGPRDDVHSQAPAPAPAADAAAAPVA